MKIFFFFFFDQRIFYYDYGHNNNLFSSLTLDFIINMQQHTITKYIKLTMLCFRNFFFLAVPENTFVNCVYSIVMNKPVTKPDDNKQIFFPLLDFEINIITNIQQQQQQPNTRNSGKFFVVVVVEPIENFVSKCSVVGCCCCCCLSSCLFSIQYNLFGFCLGILFFLLPTKMQIEK